METLQKVLARLLKSNAALKQGVQEAQILELWPHTVGETIAKHARAVRIKNKTLFIEVDHPIWKQELHANKALALKKLNEKIKKEISADHEIQDLFLVSPQPR